MPRRTRSEKPYIIVFCEGESEQGQKEQMDLHRDKVSFVIQSLNQISTMTTQ